MKRHKLSAEAMIAVRRIGPTDAQLMKMVNSNDERHMPSSAYVRWLAAWVLCLKQGYKIVNGEFVKE